MTSASRSAAPEPAGRGRRRRSRRRRRALIVSALLLALFCAMTARLFVFPATGMPARVDALVVPGGSGDRIWTALRLARQGRARYVFLSEGMYVPPYLCGTHVGTAVLLCFRPSPDSTQGEAEASGRLAREYGIRSLAVVTTPDQAWRAELRFRRCFSGRVYAVTTPLPAHLWPLMIPYQWAATIKAELVNRGC